MSVQSLFLWFCLGWVFSVVTMLPIWGFRVIRNLLAAAASDIRES